MVSSLGFRAMDCGSVACHVVFDEVSAFASVRAGRREKGRRTFF
jgi:hypothetical protein